MNKLSILKITLQFKDGSGNFLNGTRCDIFGEKSNLGDNSSTILHENVLIKDNLAIFNTHFSGQITLDKIFAGTYWKKINKTIVLNFGEIAEMTIIVEQSKEQIFQVVDNDSRPLENCHVYFSEENYFRKINIFDIKDYLKIFTETGVLPNNEMIALTDKNGFAKTIRFFDQENDIFPCYVFSKTHGIQTFEIMSKNTDKIIELKMKNTANLSLTVKFNNEIYLKEVSFKCLQMQTTQDLIFEKNPPQKIVGGKLELSHLLANKYTLQLTSNDFQKDEFLIDLTNSNNLDFVINLRPSENYIHGYVRDMAGKPLEKIDINFSFEKLSYHLQTNEKGYYKLSGLDSKAKCWISINSDRPSTTNLSEEVSPSNEEFNIILDKEQQYTLKVFGLDGKPLKSFSYNLNVYQKEDGSGIPRLMSGGSGRNGESSDKIIFYGYYHFSVEIPDAPPINKVIPILKAEDNVPIILQAAPGFSLSVLVVKPDGSPLEDVIVTKDNDLGLTIDGMPNAFIVTDKTGFFKLENCLVDDFYWLFKKGYTPIPLEIKEGIINTKIKFTFSNTFQINGKILSSKPLESIRIQGIYKYSTKGSYYVYSQTNADNTFIIDGLFPGDWIFSFYLDSNNKSPRLQRMTITGTDDILTVDIDQPVPNNNAIKILEVMKNSAASKAGLQAKDLIITYGGMRTHNLGDLNQAKNAVKNDTNTTIQILRNKKLQDIAITTGQLGIAIEEIYESTIEENK